MYFKPFSLPADADSAAEGGGSPTPGVSDTLTCGACRRAFALADIVRFIQHKISSCDKDLTSYHCYSGGKCTSAIGILESATWDATALNGLRRTTPKIVSVDIPLTSLISVLR